MKLLLSRFHHSSLQDEFLKIMLTLLSASHLFSACVVLRFGFYFRLDLVSSKFFHNLLRENVQKQFMKLLFFTFYFVLILSGLVRVQAGKSALDYARERGKHDVARLIEVRFQSRVYGIRSCCSLVCGPVLALLGDSELYMKCMAVYLTYFSFIRVF
jgi:hypothetical protein